MTHYGSITIVYWDEIDYTDYNVILQATWNGEEIFGYGHGHSPRMAYLMAWHELRNSRMQTEAGTDE